jgi:uncharacterized protein YegP (UPF0339 family)
MRGELFKDRQGEWRFRLIARNNRKIAPSEGYGNRQDALDTLHAIAEEPLEEILEIGFLRPGEIATRTKIWPEQEG